MSIESTTMQPRPVLVPLNLPTPVMVLETPSDVKRKEARTRIDNSLLSEIEGRKCAEVGK
jgi:hypothetical protein